MAPTRKPVKRKRYDSPIRDEAAERTRIAILDAARALFIDHGYAAMKMQDIADRAGVALDTVYEVVGKKPLLARTLIETAISGRDRAVTAQDRGYVQRIKAESTARGKLALYADALVDIHQRLAPLVRALQSASGAHPDLGRMWREISERRARNMRELAGELLATGDIRPGLSLDRVADVLWAMNSPELYLLLVAERSWTPADYGTWLRDAWERLLLR